MATNNCLFPSKFTLSNGIKMPSIGLGTYRIRDAALIMKTVDYALAAGYRLFDTAVVYGNEAHLQNAFKTLLPKYGLKREDIFVTSKLSPADHGSDETVIKAFNTSLNNLGLNYIDLYLIHFPGAAKLASEDTRNVQLRISTWAALTKLYENGKIKAIGVSNFTISHLMDLLKYSYVKPTVNQVEWHPYYYETDLLKFCRENGIILQAYCSLGGTSAHNNDLLEEPIIKKIAKKYQVTCAQVLLVWALQQDVAIIPKSTNPNRIKDNITLNFTLTDEDISAIDMLGKHNLKYAWDPKTVA